MKPMQSARQTMWLRKYCWIELRKFWLYYTRQDKTSELNPSATLLDLRSTANTSCGWHLVQLISGKTAKPTKGDSAKSHTHIHTEWIRGPRRTSNAVCSEALSLRWILISISRATLCGQAGHFRIASKQNSSTLGKSANLKSFTIPFK